MILFGLLSKAIFALGAVIAVFIVAWYFYIHDHAARTTGGVEASLSRALDGYTVECRDTGRGWRCRISDASGDQGYLAVFPRGKKNCWRAARPDGDLEGCVKVLDYVRGIP